MNTTEKADSYTPKPKKSLVIENLDPADTLLKATFPKIIEEHIARYKLVGQHLKERTNDPLTIIDTASGRGYGSAILAEDFPNAKIVVGLEIGKAYVQKAVAKYAHGKDKAPSFVPADVSSIPLKSESADVITGFEITEHIEKELQDQYIGELYRVLKPGGIAFVSIPHRYSFEVNQQGKVVRSGLHTNPHHLHEPTHDEMIDTFTKTGFRIQEELGQVAVSPQEAETMRQINKVIPIWPIFAWHPGQDVQVKPIPKGKIALTHIFILEKPIQ